MSNRLKTLQENRPSGIHNPSVFLLKRWFSLEEASVYTGFKAITLRKAVYKGELGVGQKAGRGKLYFDVYELDQWMLRDFGPYKGPIDERIRNKQGQFIKTE